MNEQILVRGEGRRREEKGGEGRREERGERREGSESENKKEEVKMALNRKYICQCASCK